MQKANMNYQAALIQAIFANNPVATTNPISTALAPNHGAIGIYKSNYIENGIRALSISYPTVVGVMDPADFRKLAKAYLLQHPKTCFDWADYGQGLSDFMLSIDALASMPFLPEVALIDWHLMHIERAPNKVFDGASFALLQTTDLHKLAFVAAPGLQTMQALFPVQELYTLVHGLNNQNNQLPSHAYSNNKDPQQAQTNINNLLNTAIKSRVFRSIILWREEYKGLFEYCDNASAKAFNSIIQQQSISDVLGHFGDNETAMTHWLHQHIQSKKIYAVVEK